MDVYTNGGRKPRGSAEVNGSASSLICDCSVQKVGKRDVASLPICGTTDDDLIGCSPGISARVSEAVIPGFSGEKWLQKRIVMAMRPG
jgi:hypothetical protein